VWQILPSELWMLHSNGRNRLSFNEQVWSLFLSIGRGFSIDTLWAFSDISALILALSSHLHPYESDISLIWRFTMAQIAEIDSTAILELSYCSHYRGPHCCPNSSGSVFWKKEKEDFITGFQPLHLGILLCDWTYAGRIGFAFPPSFLANPKWMLHMPLWLH